MYNDYDNDIPVSDEDSGPGVRSGALTREYRELDEAVKREVIDVNEVLSLCSTIRSVYPGDRLVGFYASAVGRDKSAAADFMDDIDVYKYRNDIETIVGFAIKTVCQETELSVIMLIDRAFSSDSAKRNDFRAMLRDKLESGSGEIVCNYYRDVYIMYADCDRLAAARLARQLEMREGFSCFIALRDFPDGVGTLAERSNAITSCAAVVFVSSKLSRKELKDTELAALMAVDFTRAPARAVVSGKYSAIPDKCKKPRVEYLLDDHTGTFAELTTEQLFTGEPLTMPHDVCSRLAELVSSARAWERANETRVARDRQKVAAIERKKAAREDAKWERIQRAEKSESDRAARRDEANKKREKSRADAQARRDAKESAKAERRPLPDRLSTAVSDIQDFVSDNPTPFGILTVLFEAMLLGCAMTVVYMPLNCMLCQEENYAIWVGFIIAGFVSAALVALMVVLFGDFHPGSLIPLGAAAITIGFNFLISGGDVEFLPGAMAIALVITAVAAGAAVGGFDGEGLIAAAGLTFLPFLVAGIIIGNVGQIPVVPEENGFYYYMKADGTYGVYASDYDTEEIVFPSERDGRPVTSIGRPRYAASNAALKRAVIPDSVTSIDGNAFCGCSLLSDVTLPKDLMLIDRQAFYGCSSLTDIVIPGGVDDIRDAAFGDCYRLAHVKFESGVRVIGERAFEGCSALEHVEMSDQLADVWTDAFSNCIKLKTIYFYNGVNMMSSCFNGCPKLTVYVAWNDHWGAPDNSCGRPVKYEYTPAMYLAETGLTP